MTTKTSLNFRIIIAALFALIALFYGRLPVALASHKPDFGWSSYTSGPWTVLYGVSDTDSLAINHATWNGIDNFRDMKLPQITVEYPSSVIIDELGIGQDAYNKLCPGYPQITTYYDGGGQAIGFGISAEFRFIPATCGQFPPTSGYTYVQVYDFWYNGVVVPQVRIYGPGLQDDARYNVFYRLDLSAGGPNDDDFLSIGLLMRLSTPLMNTIFTTMRFTKPLLLKAMNG